MKPILNILSLVIVLFSILSVANAQDLSKIKPLVRSIFKNENVYKTIDELEVKKVYNHQQNVVIHDAIKYVIRPSNGNFIRYTVVNDDESIIQPLPLLKFVNSGATNTIEFRKEGETPTILDNPSDYYFKIVDELTTPAKMFLATEQLTAIPITIPIKYRFNASDTESRFTLDANINYGFGYKIRINPNPYKEQYVRALLAIGVGLQEYMPRDSISSETFQPNSELIFTYATGMTYEAGSNFNIGLFLGWDKMFGDNRDWYYQNKPWLGIGIGYKFD